MSPNDADGMANSVDPDETAPLAFNLKFISSQCTLDVAIISGKTEVHLIISLVKNF